MRQNDLLVYKMASNVRSCEANGKAVQGLRAAKGWSVEELAAKAGLSTGTIQNLERGQRVFLCTLRKCAEALGVECSQIMASGDTEPIPEYPPRFEITIKLSFDYSAFDQCESFVSRIERLAAALGFTEPIDITDTEPGSVNITLNLADKEIYWRLEDARRCKTAAKRREWATERAAEAARREGLSKEEEQILVEYIYSFMDALAVRRGVSES